MLNKYLTKIAGIQKDVDDTLNSYYDNMENIEEDMVQAHTVMGNAVQSLGSVHPVTGALISLGSYGLGKAYGHAMNIDEKHEDNEIQHGKMLLQIGDITHELDRHQANRVIEALEIPSEFNGYQAAIGVPTLGAGVAGAIYGGKAAYKLSGGNSLMGLAGATAGGLGSGFLTSKIMNTILGNKRDARNRDIYNIRENEMQSAYDKIRHRINTVNYI